MMRLTRCVCVGFLGSINIFLCEIKRVGCGECTRNPTWFRTLEAFQQTGRGLMFSNKWW